MALLTIGSTALKEPTSLDVTYFDIVQEDTTSSGKTVTDIIKLDKIQASVSYDNMSVAERDTLRALLISAYYISVTFGAGVVTSDTKTITAKVVNRSNAIKFLTTAKGKIDFKFELEEQ